MTNDSLIEKLEAKKSKKYLSADDVVADSAIDACIAIVRAHNPAPEAKMPEGWRIYTADFSIEGVSGSVMLVRDDEGKRWWNALPDEEKEKWPLYSTGRGRTIAEATEAAIKALQDTVIEDVRVHSDGKEYGIAASADTPKELFDAAHANRAKELSSEISDTEAERLYKEHFPNYYNPLHFWGYVAALQRHKKPVSGEEKKP